MFADFAWKWFDEYVIPNNKYSEQRMKRYILGSSLVPFFGTLRVDAITTHHIEQYKAHVLKGGLARKTVNNRLAILGKCLTTAYEWYGFPGPAPKRAPLKCPPAQTTFLSADECSLLLAHADGVIREMILTALRTGMRQGELKGLQWPSINWEARIITVRHSRCDRTKQLESPKNNRERHIPMDIDIQEVLFKRKRATGYVFLNDAHQPFDGQCLIRRLNKVRDEAGLRRFGWHTLRHTFASHLAMKGAPLHIVQALLGHSTITTTMRYAHVAPSALRAAIEMLNPKTMPAAILGQPVGNEWISTQNEEAAQQYLTPENAYSPRYNHQ
ncbi:site-specific integrase [Bradyrhizobium japonicum]|nr:site-specific integrase [Bradyrhizobium japonicum]